MEKEVELKRALGIGYTTLFGVGLILGAGIYVLVGRIAEYVGDAIWISVLFATVIAILTGLSYAEFASMFPKAASSHTYVQHTFPKLRLLAFLSGWLIAFEGVAGAVTAAVGFARYFVGIFALSMILVPTVALILLLIMSFINWYGIEESGKLIVIFTFVEAMGLILVSLLGLLFPKRESVQYFQITTNIDPVLAVLLGAAVFYFAFTGFELQPTLAEEVKEPKKIVPKAIILALLICSLLYLLVAISVVRLLPPDQLAKSPAPLADAAGRAWESAYLILAAVALFSTSNTVLGFLVSSSRLIYGLSDEGILPPKLREVHKKRQTPHFAVLISAFIAVLILMITEYLPELTGWKVISIAGKEYPLIDLVGKTASLACLIVFVIINIAVVVFRFREPELKREFKVKPLILPIVGAILTVIFIVTSFLDWIIWVTTGVVVLIGLVLYHLSPKMR